MGNLTSFLILILAAAAKETLCQSISSDVPMKQSTNLSLTENLRTTDEGESVETRKKEEDVDQSLQSFSNGESDQLPDHYGP